jgi:hypothetical protein
MDLSPKRYFIGKRWMLKVYDLTGDRLSAASGTKWILANPASQSAEFVVFDEDAFAVTARCSLLKDAIDAASASMSGNGQITLCLSSWESSDAIRFSRPNVMASIDEWRTGRSFVTHQGIDRSRDEFLQYLHDVLTTPSRRSGCGYIAVVVLIVIGLFVTCRAMR